VEPRVAGRWECLFYCKITDVPFFVGHDSILISGLVANTFNILQLSTQGLAQAAVFFIPVEVQ
jgi:hypothetical protein